MSNKSSRTLPSRHPAPPVCNLRAARRGWGAAGRDRLRGSARGSSREWGRGRAGGIGGCCGAEGPPRRDGSAAAQRQVPPGPPRCAAAAAPAAVPVCYLQRQNKGRLFNSALRGRDELFLEGCLPSAWLVDLKGEGEKKKKPIKKKWSHRSPRWSRGMSGRAGEQLYGA